MFCLKLIGKILLIPVWFILIIVGILVKLVVNMVSIAKSFVRGERPMLDDKYNLKKHPNVKWTEDGGAPPYDYAKAPRSHDDLNIDIERLDDYELLCEEDILGKEQPF